MVRRTLLLIFAAGLHAASLAPPADSRVAEHLIRTTEEKYDGCSCTLYDRPSWTASSRPIFVSDIGGHYAWKNLAARWNV
jgi:hypothetical protein